MPCYFLDTYGRYGNFNPNSYGFNWVIFLSLMGQMSNIIYSYREQAKQVKWVEHCPKYTFYGKPPINHFVKENEIITDAM